MKKLRTEMGVSQALLAQTCGCDVSSISKLERGQTQPSLYFMLLLSKGLDVEPEDLLSETLKNHPEVNLLSRK